MSATGTRTLFQTKSEPSSFPLITPKKKTALSTSKQQPRVGFDVQYRAYADTDTLSIFFAKATPGLISHTEEIAPGILADYSGSEQLISLDLNLASVHTPCHFYDISDVVNGKEPLALSWDYSMDSAKLTVFLTSEQSTGLEEHTEDANIFVGTNAQGLWQAIIIKDALVFVPSGR